MATPYTDEPLSANSTGNDTEYEYYYYYYYYNNDENQPEPEPELSKADQAFILRTTLFLYLSPILLFVGTFGNIVTLIVLQSRAFRKTPTSFILSTLALVDIAVLINGLCRPWLLALTENALDVRGFTNAGCKVHVFCTYLFPQLSAWTLVLMTIERLFSVTCPFKARSMKSKLKTRVTCCWVLLFCILASINAHAFKNLHLFNIPDKDGAENATKSVCYYSEESRHFMYYIWPIIDSLLASVIPGVIILVANVTIIVFKGRVTPITTTGSATLRVHRADDTQSRSITLMLLSISALFLLTTTPGAIYFMGYEQWKDVSDAYTMSIAFTTVVLLGYINNTLNFVMYCVSGNKFRQALRNLTRCGPDARMSVTQSHTNSVANSNYVQKNVHLGHTISTLNGNSLVLKNHRMSRRDIVSNQSCEQV